MIAAPAVDLLAGCCVQLVGGCVREQRVSLPDPLAVADRWWEVGFGTLHVKTLVVDGRDAIVTGANPQAHHNDGTPWRDSGYRFTGDIAVSLLADFDNAWRKAALWTCGSDQSKPYTECSGVAPRPTYVVRRPASMASGLCRPMMVATRQIDMNPTSNRIDNPQDQAFLAGWAAAQSGERADANVPAWQMRLLWRA